MSEKNHQSQHVEQSANKHDVIESAPRSATDSVNLEVGEIEKVEILPPSAEDQLEALGIPDWRGVEKRMVRRLDMTLLPCLWLLYIFNYLDRSSLGQARISTLEEDIGLSGSDFATAVSILSYGYILGQIPSNMIITKTRPSIYLCTAAIVWSGVAAATIGVKSAQALWAVRFLLGVVEAPLFPGALMMLGSWYTRREIAFRMSILYSAQTIAQCIAGLLAAAIYETLEGKYGIAGWQWLYISLCCGGCAVAIISLFILPDLPHQTTGSTRWSMTEDMRIIARVRMEADRVTSTQAKAGIWTGLKMTIFDGKMWLIAMYNIGLSAAYGFNNFYPSIVRGFGHSPTITLLMTAPAYVFATICALINCFHSDRKRERGFHVITPIAIGCAGYIVCLATTNNEARYGASFIYVAGMYAANPLISTWAATTMGRTPEKRAIALATINVLGQIGNIISPYFFLESQEPIYRLAFIMMLVMACIAILSALLLKLWLTRSNRKLFRRAQANNTVYQPYVT